MAAEPERYAEQFVTNGCQYYVAARFAMSAGLLPVMGNLFHHAVEHLLKGGLARKRTMAELAKKASAGHHLDKLWLLFKADFPTNDLSKHNQTIIILKEFESIRYPDKIVEQGMEAMANWFEEDVTPFSIPASSSPKFRVVVENIDLLVADIFKESSWNPQAFLPNTPTARNAIKLNNRIADLMMG